MRHSVPSLTASVYTDPKLLDVAILPDLPLGIHDAFGKYAPAKAAVSSLRNA